MLCFYKITGRDMVVQFVAQFVDRVGGAGA
jgi:hypothetical protein